ncbi:arylesterase [Cellulophaga tyrosinoxydans]|uniref:Acyl-CoA thioesterase-1 n=1 Tax=Cellulophaga tyrosinoxydans TaxID=504486 RepID=A0A1W2BIR3_9FLAO|nr:arylesterase [Cellulophaga tyrosinoxydans]SMC72776.1 acyl-CoA thioesterase-1 [Cellulophaga tyrosinoxydans]
MSKAENRQLMAILPTPLVHKFLKFCYFIIALLVLSCGETKKDTQTDATPSKEETTPTKTTTNSTKTILCFGDSITAGYGLEDSEDAYPGVLQEKIDALQLDYTVINSGLSGETTAGGKSRIDWVLNQKVDIFLLELGANDGLRGVPLSETRANLQAIIDIVKQKSPKTTIILAGMELPPNMGQEYTTEFRQLYADLAQQNNLDFIPFILKDVGGIKALNQKGGIHPTVEGHQIVAHTVWEVLQPLL